MEEWDLFGRTEKLEEKIKEIEGPVLMKVLIPMVYYTFLMSFYALCLYNPRSARKYKDIILGRMRRGGVNPYILEVLEELLTSLVEDFEHLAKD